MKTAISYRSSVATIVAIALLAFGLEPVVHEVLGHCVMAWLLGIKVTFISSTVVEANRGNLLVPASGPIANLLFGWAAYRGARRVKQLGPPKMLLWYFALANLFLGTGYILFSGLLNFGDAADLISGAGLQPGWLYRGGLVIFGFVTYYYVAVLGVQDMVGLIRDGLVFREDIRLLIYPACGPGALLYLLASLFTPKHNALILGFAMAFGVVLGFTIVAAVTQREAKKLPAGLAGAAPDLSRLNFNPVWVVFAALFTGLFVFVMGRGVRLH